MVIEEDEEVTAGGGEEASSAKLFQVFYYLVRMTDRAIHHGVCF